MNSNDKAVNTLANGNEEVVQDYHNLEIAKSVEPNDPDVLRLRAQAERQIHLLGILYFFGKELVKIRSGLPRSRPGVKMPFSLFGNNFVGDVACQDLLLMYQEALQELALRELAYLRNNEL
jgi:hypothetical protein